MSGGSRTPDGAFKRGRGVQVGDLSRDTESPEKVQLPRARAGSGPLGPPQAEPEKQEEEQVAVQEDQQARQEKAVAGDEPEDAVAIVDHGGSAQLPDEEEQPEDRGQAAAVAAAAAALPQEDPAQLKMIRNIEDCAHFVETIVSRLNKTSKVSEGASNLRGEITGEIEQFAASFTPSEMEDAEVIKPFLRNVAGLADQMATMMKTLDRNLSSRVSAPFREFVSKETEASRRKVASFRQAEAKHKAIISHPGVTPDQVQLATKVFEKKKAEAAAATQRAEVASTKQLIDGFSAFAEVYLEFFKAGFEQLVKVIPEINKAQVYSRNMAHRLEKKPSTSSSTSSSSRRPASMGSGATSSSSSSSSPTSSSSSTTPNSSTSPLSASSRHRPRKEAGDRPHSGPRGGISSMQLLGEEDSSSEDDMPVAAAQTGKEPHLCSVGTQEEQRIWKFEVGLKTKRRGASRKVLTVNIETKTLTMYDVKTQQEEKRALSTLAKVTRSAKSPKKLKLWWRVKDGGSLACERVFFLNVTQMVEFYEASWAGRSGFTKIMDGKLKVMIGTWNMGAAEPPPDLSGWLRVKEEDPDLIAIAVQECKYDVANGSCHGDWVNLIRRNLGANYFKVSHATMLNMLIVVFCHRRHHLNVHKVVSGSEATGLGNVIGNKGGVAVALWVCETSVCFIGSHLAARIDAKRLAERNKNYSQIVEGLTLKAKAPFDITTHYDHIFWAGDLNYRITCPRDDALVLIEQKEYQQLLDHDQLRQEMDGKRCFVGFQEAPITFMPTYRFERGSMEWSTHSKGGGGEGMRCPSYCDRVLWRSCKSHPAQCISYAPCHDIRSSDHHPLGAFFVVPVKLPNVPHLRRPCRVLLRNVRLNGLSDPSSDYSLLLNAPFLTSSVASAKATKAPVWNNGVPPLIPLSCNAEYLQRQHIKVCVRDKAGEVAQGRIALLDTVSDGYSSFEVQMLNKGLGAGTLEGEVFIEWDTEYTKASDTPRDVVQTGFLLKQGGARKNWKRRWFVLKANGELSYYPNIKAKKAINTFQVTGSLASEYTGVNKQNCIAIDMDKRKFICCADSAEDMRVWLAALQKFSK